MPEHRNGERMAHATDRAVADGGVAAGVTAELGAAGWTQTGELQFEPSRGYHAVLGGTKAGQRLAVKGAVAERLGRRGCRVLAAAERDASSRRDLRPDRM